MITGLRYLLAGLFDAATAAKFDDEAAEGTCLEGLRMALAKAALDDETREMILRELPSCTPQGRILSSADESEGSVHGEWWWLWVNAVGAIVCVVGAALAAGLTMGLVSLDPLDLKVKEKGGSVEQRRAAQALLRIVEEPEATQHDYAMVSPEDPEDPRRRERRRCCKASRHHFILVSFLLFNSLMNEALPLFLDELVPAYAALMLSVVLVLVFGEIIPSAIFTGPNQLRNVALMLPVIRTVLCVVSPISYPIAWLLDMFLGHQHLRDYSRQEISAFVRVQHELKMRRQKFRRDGTGDQLVDDDAPSKDLTLSESLSLENGLSADETDIVEGVLSTAEKGVSEAMTPMSNVYSVSLDGVMDFKTMSEVFASSFSRVPVCAPKDPGDLRGFLLVKRLITLDPNAPRQISSLDIRKPAFVSPNASLLETLNKFQEGHSHMAFVSVEPEETRRRIENEEKLTGASRPLGILTLEDIVEKIIQEEIYDEDDLMIKEVHELLAKGLVAWRQRIARGLPRSPVRMRRKAAKHSGPKKAGGRTSKLLINVQAMSELSGKLSKTQLDCLLQAFGIFDRDSDGRITKEELGQALRSFGQEPTEEELAEMISVVDADGDGAVDFREFVHMISIPEDPGLSAQDQRDKNDTETNRVSGERDPLIDRRQIQHYGDA